MSDSIHPNYEDWDEAEVEALSRADCVLCAGRGWVPTGGPIRRRRRAVAYPMVGDGRRVCKCVLLDYTRNYPDRSAVARLVQRCFCSRWAGVWLEYQRGVSRSASRFVHGRYFYNLVYRIDTRLAAVIRRELPQYGAVGATPCEAGAGDWHLAPAGSRMR